MFYFGYIYNNVHKNFFCYFKPVFYNYCYNISHFYCGVTGQASPNSLRHAELVSASHDLAILKQVQDDDSTIVKPDLLL